MTGLNLERLPALDREAALERVGGDMELLREIAALFLKEGVRAAADLRAVVERRDSAGIERAAHSLKGSVAIFGAGPAFQAAWELEKQGRGGDLSQVDAKLRNFESSLARLCSELREFVAVDAG